ncbi:hypothetical protein ABZX98_29405 [Streptomyces sp. NPDC002992]|uniref:hypothetical protein n=1 Tax=Streptomyces sp. NPDC002992 TaxID=3154273 RepID=UPI00339E1844
MGRPSDPRERAATRQEFSPRSGPGAGCIRPPRTGKPRGLVDALVEAGVDAARIQVAGVFRVVTPNGGRMAVVTDDTEEYVVRTEGPWPFKAALLSPDGARTKTDHSSPRTITAQLRIQPGSRRERPRDYCAAV